MKLSVKGKQIDVGDALRGHVETQLNETVGKFFADGLEATVTFSREAHLFCADITVHAAAGLTLNNKASATEIYPAFDAALTRLTARLRRHKSKLKQHHHDSGARDQAEAMMASSFVLHGDSHEEEVNDNPAIVAEMTTPVENLTVGEAVMRLDLGDLPALMFHNRKHGGLNMIYRRADGHIGWVDPSVAQQQPAPQASLRKAN
jgi:ribosomal subunit interface protein